MRGASLRALVVAGLVVCVVLAFAVAPAASSAPDGLERVALDEGFAGAADDHALGELPTADYAIDGVDDERLSTGLAGVLGIAACFAVTVVTMRLVRRRSAPAA